MICLAITLYLVLLAWPAHSATYYISPSGSNSNNGLSVGAPFLTFAYAINASRASCGDTLILANGTYGDGTSTGKISISGLNCSLGNELTITAANQRKAKINDNGSGKAVNITNSSYVIIDGLYARSADVSGTTGGYPFFTSSNNHITLRNLVARNPNRYNNTHTIAVEYSQDILIEDSESYVFHRHCVEAYASQRVVVRRQYCNPRGGKIPGSFGLNEGPLGSGAAIVTMYPCKDCILENSIADGTTNPMYINEMNAAYYGNVPMSGSKVLGSICYKCNYGNGIYPNSRKVADATNHTPLNITIRDVAMIDHGTNGNGIRCSDCVNVTIDHVTILGTNTGSNGITLDQTSTGATAAQSSATITNSVVVDMAGTGFTNPGGGSYSGNHLYSYSNGSAFSPGLPGNWGSASTANPSLGTCKLWIPSGSPLKGAGTGGSDIGATILYRYVNGVLTTTPLWDQTTGEFPYGEADLDNINRVAGQSLYDFHTRINVNRNGCNFPPGYGVTGPTNPATVVTSTNLSGAHIHPIDIGMDSLTVWVMVRWDDFLNTPTAEPATLTSSCGGGESIPQIAPTWFTPAGDRTLKTFGKINPSSGTCTLTPTFTSSNVSGWIIISRETDNVASYGTVAAASGLSTSPTVTAAACANCTFIDAIATSNAGTLSVGPDQILVANISHPTAVLRGASSEQSSSNGTIISYSLSNSVGWIIQAVPLIPSGGGGGSSAVFTITHYRCDGLLGMTATPEVTLGQLAAMDTPCEVGFGGALRLRIEISVSVDESEETGIALFCKKVGGSFAQVQNTFGSHYVRYYGPGVESNIPIDGTPTTKQFSGSPFQASITKRDGSTPFLLPPIASGTETEIDMQIVIGNGLTSNDVVQCEIWKDDGSGPIGTHNNTITIQPITNSAMMGF